MRVGLVGCVKSKQSQAAPARELYVSPLFRGRRAWVERTCDRWFILSAKHGLVEPDRVLAPYDEILMDCRALFVVHGAPGLSRRLSMRSVRSRAWSLSCTPARPTSTMGWWQGSESEVHCLTIPSRV
jgi:hypothetical protein